MIDVLFLNIATPPVLGIYESGVLASSVRLGGKISDELPRVFARLMQTQKIGSVTYINTPGSYMSIKLAYVFFSVLSGVAGFKLYAASGFCFNGGAPIKAMGKSFFVQEANVRGGVAIKQADLALDLTSDLATDLEPAPFELPPVLDTSGFVLGGEPIYITPPV
ncbi:MAG: hypothetical protein ACTTIC_07120 [Helicobacteraceae bacterium]